MGRWSKDIKNFKKDRGLSMLIKQCQEGNIRAFESIYEHFKAPIFNLIYRYTYNHAITEDLVHDIFIKIFTQIQQLKKEEAFINWLYRIAINTCRDYLRRKERKLWKSISLNEVENYMATDTDIEHENITNKILEEAIHNLPLKMKSVFLLHDVQGFKHEEIAQILKCSIGTSKSQLFKARAKIRKYLIKKFKKEQEK